MSKLITMAERLERAHALIQKARDLPVPAEGGRYDFNYVAEIKDLFQQARDLVKFISYSVSATPEIKKEVADIVAETKQVEKELLHGD